MTGSGDGWAQRRCRGKKNGSAIHGRLARGVWATIAPTSLITQRWATARHDQSSTGAPRACHPRTSPRGPCSRASSTIKATLVDATVASATHQTSSRTPSEGGAHAGWWRGLPGAAPVELWRSSGGKGQGGAATGRPAMAMERHGCLSCQVMTVHGGIGADAVPNRDERRGLQRLGSTRRDTRLRMSCPTRGCPWRRTRSSARGRATRLPAIRQTGL
jgi:hypothetical protein